MKVEVEKTFPMQLHEDTLHLNKVGGSTCNLTRLSNATHLVAVIPLHACGTLVEVRPPSTDYRRSSDLSNSLVFRRTART